MIRDRGLGLLPSEEPVTDAGEVIDLGGHDAGSVEDVVDLVALPGVSEVAPVALGIRDLIARNDRERGRKIPPPASHSRRDQS